MRRVGCIEEEGKLSNSIRRLIESLDKDTSTRGLLPLLPAFFALHGDVNATFADSTISSLCTKLASINKQEYTTSILATIMCHGTVYMTNVKIPSGGNGFILFKQQQQQQQQLQESRKIILPPLKHIRYRKVSHSQLAVGYAPSSSTFQGSCKGKTIYDGTLHVFGQVTTHNHFHVIHDNILPYYAHVVLDSYIAPEFLMKKRAVLMGISLPAKHAPHYQVLHDSFDDVFNIKNIHNMCFRRVLWGNGPRLLYHHALVLLRRFSTELLRNAVIDIYKLSSLTPYASIQTGPFKTQPGLLSTRCEDGASSCLLNVVMYSRAKEKPGRSIQAEVCYLPVFMVLTSHHVSICFPFRRILSLN